MAPEHEMLILCPAFLGLSVQTDLASLLGGEGQAAGQVQSLRCVASDLQRAPPSFANLVLGDTRTSRLLDRPALRAAAARMEAVTGIPPAAVEELWRGENVLGRDRKFAVVFPGRTHVLVPVAPKGCYGTVTWST